MNDPHTICRRHVRRRFDRAADSFDSADFVHRNTCDGLFARLEPVVIDARTIVDLGSATGSATGRLAKRFRGSRVIAVDLSRAMLEKCRAKKSWLSRTSLVQADAAALPFADHSVDIVFANMLLPWVTDPATVAAEVSRVLRKDGLFVFATLGPDSLLPLRNAWREVDNRAFEHVNRFLDMHDVGDALVRSGLRDPVLDVDRLTVTYEDADALFSDLTAAGARNSLVARDPGLLGKSRFAAVKERLQASGIDDRISLDLELVYGHCWGSGARQGGGDVRIDPNSIMRRRR